MQLHALLYSQSPFLYQPSCILTGMLHDLYSWPLPQVKHEVIIHINSVSAQWRSSTAAKSI